MGHFYSVGFSSADSSAVVKDIFQIQGSTTANFRLRELHLGKIAAALTSTAIELLAVSIWRGSSLTSAGGATAAPTIVDGRYSATATFTTLVNSSSPGSSGTSAKLLFARPWNTQQEFVVKWGEKDAPTCVLSQRLQVRMGAPGAAIVIGGSMVIEEVPHVPGSTVR